MKKKITTAVLLILLQKSFSQKDSSLISKQSPDSLETFFQIPLFSTSGTEAESELEQQDVSSLLQSSRDLYTQYASFQFGVARYKMRGYPAENQMVLMNGVNVNNPETGFASWSNWGGLNDVTRFTETRFGNTSSRYGFSGAGGYTYIDSKASSFKKGTRFSYASANRIFRNRIMVTHSTGILKNGWALSASASWRFGNEVYLPGTYFNAKAFYISADKQINKKHLLSFTGFNAPIEQGRSSAETLETYRITHNNYYNASWGYQNGKVRNASVSRNNKPMLMLSDIYSPNKNSRLSSTFYYSFGQNSNSGLNFYNAPNPRPDYYKYLPSYFYPMNDQSGGDAALIRWETDVNTRQINWDELINMNRANLYSPPAQGGQILNTTDTRARYIVERRVDKINHTGINLLYNLRKDNLFLSAGVNAFIYKSRKYKEMEDLLGATYWIDVDQFAQNLGVDHTTEQNDIDQPDRKIYKDNRFGYDYIVNINKAEIWGQAEYNLKTVDFYGGLSLSSSRMWRKGMIANGKFPLNSKGESDKTSFSNYGFKAGTTLKLNGRNFLTANINILTRAPEAANLFISPKVRNDLVDDVQNEEVLSLDLNYLAKYPTLKIRATVYSTQVNHQTWLRTYWSDTYNTGINLIMTGVNQKYQGIELGIEKTLMTSHALQLIFGYGRSTYNNQPKLQAWQDNNNSALFYNRKVYLKNYNTGGSPQLVSAFGYRYNGTRSWFAGIYGSYFDEIYIEPNPDRRTEEAAGKYQQDEKELAHEILQQEKLPAYFTINVNGGKTFRLHKKQNLSINVSVNNLLNNRGSISSGYEQLRWDALKPEKFPNKYSYMPGTSYMAIINYSF